MNALQWLLPKARDTDYLTKLFDKTIGKIYTIEKIRDGGEEPELRDVFQFIRRHVARDFKVDMKLTAPFARADDFKRPDQAMQSVFDTEKGGVFVLGFEGFDSHWTVARGLTANEVISRLSTNLPALQEGAVPVMFALLDARSMTCG